MAQQNIRTFCPANQQEWRKWLEKHHQSEDAVWLVFYKKNTPQYNLSWSDAVDEALCFGWIDSVKNSIDDEKYKQYFSKRKPESIWSKINKDKIKELSAAGKMTDAGQKCIDIAKQNGSWNILDDVEKLIVPDDLNEAFKHFPGSKNFYESQTKSLKKGMLYWVISAKRPATRSKRIREIVENGAQNQLAKHFRT